MDNPSSNARLAGYSHSLTALAARLDRMEPLLENMSDNQLKRLDAMLYRLSASARLEAVHRALRSVPCIDYPEA